MKNRRTILRLLIQADRPLEEISKALTQFGWDSKELVTLRRDDILRILRRFLSGKMTAAQVEEWANLIEGRDDIHFENVGNDNLHEIIIELANPLLQHALDQEGAREMIRRLGLIAPH